jgi:hypothetical protein
LEQILFSQRVRGFGILLHKIFNGQKKISFLKMFCTEVSEPSGVSAEDEKAGAAFATPGS